MEANEFFKKVGINAVRSYLAAYEDHLSDELKRLVESHELVSSFGGIKRAKRILKKSYMSFNTMVSVVWNDKPFQCTLEQLEKAILDVESCQ